jgi:hypothetical protein
MLRHCLSVLSPDERDLLLRYFRDDSPIARTALANEKGVSRANLSVRICHIKNKILDRLTART